MSDTDFAITLEAPDSDGICKGTSSLEFAKYMPHNLLALNFKVEYSANLPTKPAPKPVHYVIGWQTYLPSINSSHLAHD